MLGLDDLLLLRKRHINQTFGNHICNILNVLTALDSIDTIYKGKELKRTGARDRRYDFPAFARRLIYERLFFLIQEQLAVFLKVLNHQLFAVEIYRDVFRSCSARINHPAMKELVNVFRHILHTEPFVVGDKTDLRIGHFRRRLNIRFRPLCHILAKRLGVYLLRIVVNGLNRKLL